MSRPLIGVSVRSLLMLAVVALMTGAASATVCRPAVTKPIVVVSAAQRRAAAAKVEPPITDSANGFAWPDTPLGVLKTPTGYAFFGSDGGLHARQIWRGEPVGNGKYGSIVMTTGTLDDPLGTAAPVDVALAPSSEGALDPSYPAYTYAGGGPVFEIPPGRPHAGGLLATYHAELPNDPLYAALGLAASADGGRHWTDLGEIVRLNQAYAPGLTGFEIGDGPLVLSPDGRYFYLYFPDWLANGSAATVVTTRMSVARAPVSAVLDAAFGTEHHAVPFAKFYAGGWDLQPGIGGASTDLNPNSAIAGYLDVHYDPALSRYVLIVSNDTTFGYAESIDGLSWTVPIALGTFGPIAAYPTAVGLGANPHDLGRSFDVFFTHLPADGSGWNGGALERITVSCGRG
jgi:hypothetical protein